MMTRSTEDIYTYYQQAKDLLSTDHPHYQEIYNLLEDQVADELRDAYDFADTFPATDQRAS